MAEHAPRPRNRSMPTSTIIPELAYPDVRGAVDWLCRTFGFVERLRIGEHRAQLSFGAGTIIVTRRSADVSMSALAEHAIMVRVADVDSHYAHVQQAGATVVLPPTTYPFGERQYTVYDLGGHRWTFSQTVADVDPAAWGGLLVERP
ncbi:MAG: VOC family protein [Anaerolineae bacterium]|nr:VOC family protein [Anaerolineae bacterium]